MRRTLLLIGIAILIAQPAFAQEDSYTYRSRAKLDDSSGSAKKLDKGPDPIFGNRRCRPDFSCSSINNQDNSAAVVSTLVNISNSCISKFFSLTASEGYFEEGRGLDSSNCLTTKRLPKSATGITMTPKCCVKQDSTGQTCYVQCLNLAVQ